MNFLKALNKTAVISSFLFISTAAISAEQSAGEYERLCKCEISDSDTHRAIPVLIRDFKPSTHPDFESPRHLIEYNHDNIVQKELGSDGRPVYISTNQSCDINKNNRNAIKASELSSLLSIRSNNASNILQQQASHCTTLSTFGKPYFEQWFKTIDGVNKPISKTITMTKQPSGTYKYTSGNAHAGFLPINGEGYGNYRDNRNYHFTLESHTKFFYTPGASFTFRGDDDMWIFINGHLAVNIGGVHSPLSKTVNIDSIADELGIEPNNEYSFDLFFAERRYNGSTFQFETSFKLECL